MGVAVKHLARPPLSNVGSRRPGACADSQPAEGASGGGILDSFRGLLLEVAWQRAVAS